MRSPAWFDLAEMLGAQLAPLIGAQAEEVVICNSTTVNLHQLLATLYNPAASADVVLADALCFPSDRYALQSFLRLTGPRWENKLRFVASTDGRTLSEEAIIAAMDQDVQMVVLPSVVYVSGQLLDISRLVAAAHQRGILIGFDSSHSVGVVPHRFHQDGVDFAFFCTYKYLNGGPGAPAAVYLHRRHFGRPAGLAGWFGCDKTRQFEMSAEFRQAAHAGGLQIGTPPILAAAPLRGALQLIHEAGIERIHDKSLKLTAYLRALIHQRLGTYGFHCVDPEEGAAHGGHVAASHVEAQAVSAALREFGVVADFRPPDIVRMAPAALYTSFLDCFRAVEILERIMREQVYLRYRGAHNRVS